MNISRNIWITVTTYVVVLGWSVVVGVLVVLVVVVGGGGCCGGVVVEEVVGSGLVVGLVVGVVVFLFNQIVCRAPISKSKFSIVQLQAFREEKPVPRLKDNGECVSEYVQWVLRVGDNLPSSHHNRSTDIWGRSSNRQATRVEVEDKIFQC
jgi:hypothetical protein